MFGYVPPVERRPGTPATAMPLSAAAISRLVARDARRPVMTSVTTGFPAAPRASRRGVIIDLDDTLYPRERFVRSGLAAVAHHVSVRHGIAAADAYAVMTRALASGLAGSEMQALRDRFDLPADVVAALVDVFRSHTPTVFLSAEAQETLCRLRADGWALAILTNGLPSVQFRKVAALGVTTLVDEVVYAEEHAAGGKPSAAPFRAALRALELEASACVCVGDDASRDVRGARALGMSTIRVTRPGSSVSPADEADVVIDSLRHLPGAASLLLRTVTADVA
jgi:putative hydrolase of the HAD superfamily